MSRSRNRSSSKKKQKRRGARQRGGRTHATAAPPQPASAAVHVTSRAAFERYLATELPVIVDFWAPWCGPCKVMSPIFDRVARDHAGQAHFLKINTEQLPELAGAFGIRSIPTLLVLHGDEVIDSHIGLTSEPDLTRMVRRASDRASGVTFTDRLKRWVGVAPSAG